MGSPKFLPIFSSVSIFGFRSNPLEQYHHVTMNKNTNRNSDTYSFWTQQRTQKTRRDRYLLERETSALVLDTAERTLVWALQCWNAEMPRWNSAEPLRNVWCAAALHMSFPSPLEKGGNENEMKTEQETSIHRAAMARVVERVSTC